MDLIGRIFEARKEKKQGFVLALGGGGGRGLAHLGVLQVLEEHKLKPDAIVGSSIGALFGAMYAVQPDAGLMIKRVGKILESELFNSIELPVLTGREDDGWLARLTATAKQTLLYTKAATGRSFADSAALIEIAVAFCGGESFEDAEIPLFVTAVQFPSGECQLFSADSGVKLPCAVAASMAIPGVFDPVVIDGRKYVDGGVAAELPAREARMIAHPQQLIVAVNVGSRPTEDDEPDNVFGMLDWTSEIKALHLRRYTKKYADILIEPLVSFTQWHDFSRPEQEIDKGRQAALEKMPELIEKLR